MSNVTASHAAYRRGEVLSATPGQLVVMLYDGARRFMRQAVKAMSSGEPERAHTTLRYAERIVSHLDGTLDYDQGELPQRLHSIYVFCLSQLNAARITQDTGKVEAVSALLGELREAFSQVAAEVDRYAQTVATAEHV
ncbi:MAG TPA: flagellar export chaperone FliS [Solirubrobacteraceae bacterium]|jgi:flagellar protein FliS|nr:flagellar export chaperone FliS [Solirubrobacteraceae bacterium]